MQGPGPGPRERPRRPEPFTLTGLIAEHWLPLAVIAAALASPIAYLALAPFVPLAAQLLSSLTLATAVILAVIGAWPPEEKITWQRRAEVWGYRLGTGVLIHLGIGVLVAFLINLFSARSIPLSWPEAAPFVPFWPFHLWFVIGCEGLGICPPPPG